MGRRLAELLDLPPSAEADVKQLHRLLTDKQIARRKAGITLAESFLNRDEAEVVRAWLETLKERDPILGVREAAGAILQKSKPSSPQEETVSLRSELRVRCPNGHLSRHDPRQLCRDSKIVLRAARARDADKVLVRCPTCQDEFVVEIHCGAMS